MHSVFHFADCRDGTWARTPNRTGAPNMSIGDRKPCSVGGGKHEKQTGSNYKGVQAMNYTVFTYICYLMISMGVTIWVARALSRSGRIFLVDSFLGNESLADSVNHLLVVGFYLVNIGYVTLALRYGEKPLDLTAAIEFLSMKVGLVLLVLGGMHF